MSELKGILLTDGMDSWLLGSVIEDERGPVHAEDRVGDGYTRCDDPGCTHDDAGWAGGNPPQGATVWHDDEFTETLWEAVDEGRITPPGRAERPATEPQNPTEAK
jgi:hypothetical protein